LRKTVIFSGTTEGRQLSELLSRQKIRHIVCVATQYGSDVMCDNPYADIHVGRLTEADMIVFLMDNGFSATDLVVDATHPYAAEAGRNIKEVADRIGCEYIRVQRSLDESPAEDGRILSYSTLNECICHLNGIAFDTSHAPGVSDVSGISADPGRTSSAFSPASPVTESTYPAILLTTGVKELHEFCSGINRELLDHTYVRVLPSEDSINACRREGIPQSNIIAMQGPFSYELNQALMSQYRIKHLITKNSGRNGGYEEKVRAALDLGVTVHVIERPVRNGGISVAEAYKLIVSMADTCINPEILTEHIKHLEPEEPRKSGRTILLCGCGVGSPLQLTEAVRNAIKDADAVFGSDRMLADFSAVPTKKCPQDPSVNTESEPADTSDRSMGKSIERRYIERNYIGESHIERSYTGRCYNKYLAKDIIPILEDNADIKTAAVLFSGDSGFFSGAKAAFREFREWDESADVRILPGISSVSYFAARLGESYDDAGLKSLHGRNSEQALHELIQNIRYNRKTFVLLSGTADINSLGRELISHKTDCRIYIGCNLSYDSERIDILTPKEAVSYSVNASPDNRSVHTATGINTPAEYRESREDREGYTLFIALVVNENPEKYPSSCIDTQSGRFFANKQCEFYPCHKGLSELNCLFCYCPLYYRESCPGNYKMKEKNGRLIKSCIDCNFPHDPGNYDIIISIIKEQ
jgi:precorrin-6Y C5,15-methyltransferase (decarboxylating)